jgi:hypothetical protein
MSDSQGADQLRHQRILHRKEIAEFFGVPAGPKRLTCCHVEQSCGHTHFVLLDLYVPVDYCRDFEVPPGLQWIEFGRRVPAHRAQRLDDDPGQRAQPIDEEFRDADLDGFVARGRQQRLEWQDGDRVRQARRVPWPEQPRTARRDRNRSGSGLPSTARVGTRLPARLPLRTRR